MHRVHQAHQYQICRGHSGETERDLAVYIFELLAVHKDSSIQKISNLTIAIFKKNGKDLFNYEAQIKTSSFWSSSGAMSVASSEVRQINA